MSTFLLDPAQRTFPPFDLSRLMSTVFAPHPGERVAILIDLEDPTDITDFAFLKRPELTIQRYAHDVFYEGLRNGVLDELKITGGEMFAYEMTGGSNRDMPDRVIDVKGRELSFERDIYPHYQILLCISTYSATAPLTAFCKQYHFRGATLHGVNQTILDTGLAVDYNQVSADAEKLRSGMTRADWVEIDYEVEGKPLRLHIGLGRQEAQKSHGICRVPPDVANLPAGEVYYVPTEAEGQFPLKYEDGTLGIMDVHGGRIVKASLLSGNAATIEAHNQKLASDPVTGEIGELGFGTQVLPVSGRDIQDEKILGTVHVATGRSDHLGGPLTPDRFASRMNATHDDILFSPTKTPEVRIPQVRMLRDNRTEVLLENYHPAPYLVGLLNA
jgi:hypothetical protein